MLELKYQFNVDEIVETTLLFLENRPFLKGVLWIMKFACFFVFFNFGVKFSLHAITFFDGSVVLFALFWLFYRKQMNAYFLKRRLKNKDLNQATLTIHVLKHKMWWQGSLGLQGEQRFSQTPFLYELKQGFILPLVGLAQSAKFIWIPNRAFKSTEDKTFFLNILSEKNISLKKIKE